MTKENKNFKDSETKIQYVIKEKTSLGKSLKDKAVNSAKKQVNDVKKMSDKQRVLLKNEKTDMNLDYLFKPIFIFLGIVAIFTIVFKLFFWLF